MADTNDVTTLPGVLDDLQSRFGVGGVCVVADRGLISADNVAALNAGGFEHVLATRLHRDPTCAAALAASAAPDASWIPVPQAHSAACEVIVKGHRCVVVASVERWVRDRAKTIELVAKTETELLALEDRVRAGRLTDEKASARAAQRILDRSGVARLFDLEITLDAGDQTIEVVTRPNALQACCLAALNTDTRTWNRAQLQ